MGGGSNAGRERPGEPSLRREEFVWRVWVVLGCVALAVTGALVIWFLIHFLLLALAGILLAIGLWRLADWVARRTGLWYALALTLVILALLAALVGVGWLIGSRVSQQATSMAQQLPRSWDHLHSYLDGQPWGRRLLGLSQSFWAWATAGQTLRQGAGVVLSGVDILIDAAVVLFVGLFGAATPGWYVEGALLLVPRRKRGRVREVLGHVERVWWWWLVQQAIGMATVLVLTTLGLWLLGVPLALTLGIIAALLNFIPNFGPVLSVVPGALLGLLKSPMTALWVVVLYIVVQAIQNHIVSPLLHQKFVALPAALLILAQVFMGAWAGTLGVILAPAVAVAVMVVVQTLWVRGELGEDVQVAA